MSYEDLVGGIEDPAPVQLAKMLAVLESAGIDLLTDPSTGARRLLPSALTAGLTEMNAVVDACFSYTETGRCDPLVVGRSRAIDAALSVAMGDETSDSPTAEQRSEQRSNDGSHLIASLTALAYDTRELWGEWKLRAGYLIGLQAAACPGPPAPCVLVNCFAVAADSMDADDAINRLRG